MLDILLWPLSGEAAAAIHLDQTPPYLAWDAIARNLSPYDLNPRNVNPLRAPLEDMIDFEGLRAQKDITVGYEGGVLKIKLATTKTLHFLVTDYDWRITQESTGRAY